ncbi:MAG: nicotinate (nicotinamide) nucleotide adenylyltransferase [Planctomycetes bacterium]|nr:nicotinate (nicotinamide) nucleotide adenylyltransferase [Planctomycetota bacterium]
MRVGILGGTFDPPHLGHLNMALSALESGRVERVIMIPTRIPPHKERPGISPANDRLEMARLLVEEHANISVSDMEIKREGRSYSIDTVSQLKRENPTDEFYLIIGGDMAREFPTWKDAEKLSELAEPLIIDRPGSRVGLIDAEFEGSGSFMQKFIPRNLVPSAMLDISSTEIRDRAKSGCDITAMVGKRISDYIKQHRLYN